MSKRAIPGVILKRDANKNRISKKHISFGGAPKQYPNWFLKENFFQDSIKDSMHKKCEIYFSPECYRVKEEISGGGRTYTRIIWTKQRDPDARYIFQFMNVDRLLDQKFTIQLDGERVIEETPTLAESSEILSKASDESGDFL